MPGGSYSTWLVRGGRAIAMIVAAILLHFVAQRDDESSVSTISLADTQLVFPRAAHVGRYDGQQHAHPVYDAAGSLIGYVLTTSPAADDLIGYSGPSNLIVGLSPDHHIQAVQFLSSGDTPAHVEQVRRDSEYWNQFLGKDSSDVSKSIEAVSGSTLTSLAMAEGVARRISGQSVSLRFAEPLSLVEVQQEFPSAAKLNGKGLRPGWQQVVDRAGDVLGYALRTSPQADNVIGYAGPTETWLAIASDQQHVLAIHLRKSYDTAEYVDRVRDDSAYLQQLADIPIKDWPTLEFSEAGIEGVSGATQTSFAVADGIRQTFQADEKNKQRLAESNWQPKMRDWALVSLVLGALIMSFTRLKGDRRARLAWQIVLVAGFGLWLGDLLSLALLVGWARNGIPWRSATGLTALVAVALVIPWSTRHQIYCHHLCPHGAMQEWLGRYRSWHLKLPARLSQILGMVPVIMLGLAVVLGVVMLRFDLSLLEPFDAWALRTAAFVPFVLAIIGLAASLFVPMAYCRFGCPTGALLKIVQAHGMERFRWRDGMALAILLFLSAYVFLPRALSSQPKVSSPQMANVNEFSGQAFGTTWKVKLRTGVTPSLQEELDAELRRIESTLSHWNPESQTAQFNFSRTTLAMEMSPEFLSLIQFGSQLSEKTNGAYDLTIAPLLAAWGLGPTGPQASPTDEELASLLKQVGWQKLEIDLDDGTVRKKNPRLQIDLGSLLQGYAADKLGDKLVEHGISEYLIEVGGELLARGTWEVAVENPQDAAQPLATVNLSNAALATSGVYRQADHIIDPQTGKPIPATWKLVAVVRPTGMQADGWATALIASAKGAMPIAEEEQIPALLLSADGKIEVSSAGRDWFQQTSR